MRRWTLAMLWVAAGLIACSRGYLSVTVTAHTPALASAIVQLSVSASDSVSQGGPVLLPEDPLDGGMSSLPDGSIAFTVQAPPGSMVSVFVEGLDSTGTVIARNGQTVPSITSGSHISFELFTACDTDRDCVDYDAVCKGAESCIAEGFCQLTSSAGPASLAAGAPCGPCAGTCDGMGTCLLGDCGCLFTFKDGGQGYIFNIDAGEQCDDGNGDGGDNNDTAPDHCRTNCRLPRCGDGILDSDAGEICDLGGQNGMGLGCNATCNLFGKVTTLAGGPDGGLVDGTGSGALFFLPVGIAVQNGLIYVADTYFRAIRQLDPGTGEVLTIAGGNTACVDQNGLGAAGTFCDVNALLAYDAGLLATDDSALRYVTAASPGDVTTWAGQLASDGTPATGVDAGPFGTALYGVPQGIAELDGIIYTNTRLDGYVLASDPAMRQVTIFGSVGDVMAAQQAGGMTAFNGFIYTSIAASPGEIVAFTSSGQQSLLMLSSVADGGPDAGGLVTRPLNIPNGLCNDGRSIYICESGANDMLQYDTDAGTLTLLAGNGALGMERDGTLDAGFQAPSGCVYDPATKRLYVTDKFGYTVRMIQ